MSREKRNKVILLFCIFILVLAVVAIVVSNIGKLVNDEPEADSKATDMLTEMETVYIDGEGYMRKDGIKTYLIIGLDKSGKLETSELAYNEGNQADFILLFVVDKNNNSYNLLHINRDTMTDVQKLGVFGKKISVENMQIALSHAYGDGMHNSCLNTVDAVQNLLYGAKIDKYISASMSAVGTINDFVGGVSVDIKEDLTVIDPSMTEGARVTLYGENALAFIRGRKGVGDQTNLSRMERQKQYMTALIESVKKSGKTASEFIDLFEEMRDYIVSDCGVDDYNFIFDAVKNYSMTAMISPEGEAMVNKGYMEFHVNEDNLKEIVKDLFFEKVEK